MSNISNLFDLVKPKDVSLMEMTVGDVARCISSPEELTRYADDKHWTTIEKIAFVKGFAIAAKNTFDYFSKFKSTSNTDYDRAVSEVGGDILLAETMITDCVSYYSLHSTKEAEELPFSDWFIIKRKEVVENAIQSRYNKILEQKQNNKRQSLN